MGFRQRKPVRYAAACPYWRTINFSYAFQASPGISFAPVSGSAPLLPLSIGETPLDTRKLWRQTTVSQAWIARELEMKSTANVSLCIHREGKKK